VIVWDANKFVTLGNIFSDFYSTVAIARMKPKLYGHDTALLQMDDRQTDGQTTYGGNTTF